MWAHGAFRRLRLSAAQGRALGAALAASAAVSSTVLWPAFCDKRDEARLAQGRESKSLTQFDPELLERGAKALREIKNDPNAKKVLEIARQQEITKQEELRTQSAQFAAQQQQYQIEQEKVRWDEQRKTLQMQAQQKAQLKQYEDELARKRLAAEHEKQRERNVELVALQEESAKRTEALRLQTEAQILAQRRAEEENRARIEKETMRAKALAEAEGRIKEGRENRDIQLEQLRVKGEQELRKALEGIRLIVGGIGDGFQSLLNKPEHLAVMVGAVTALAVGIYGAREGAKLTRHVLERYLGQPSLVRETSRRWYGAGRMKPSSVTPQSFEEIVLAKDVKGRLQSLAATTANTRKHGAPFRNMLFYGPPGTGKTLVAKHMARACGLDYAIMSGGDVTPLGAAAVTQLHSLFDWAGTTRKGLLLFIDEADAFLSSRGNPSMSENMRSALNALLHRTGDQTSQFVLVLATNRPEDLDDAVCDRMDELVRFPLPKEDEREQLLSLYFSKYVVRSDELQSGGGSVLRQASKLMSGRDRRLKITVEDVSPHLFTELAKETDGFSGRELSKLMAAVQAAAFGSSDMKVTPNVIRSVLDAKKLEFSSKKDRFV